MNCYPAFSVLLTHQWSCNFVRRRVNNDISTAHKKARCVWLVFAVAAKFALMSHLEASPSFNKF